MNDFKWFGSKFLGLFTKKAGGFEKLVSDQFGESQVYFYNAYGGDKKIDVRETLRARGLTNDLLKGVLKGIVLDGDSDDVKVEKIRDFVNSRLTYLSDSQNYLQEEYWADPYTVYDKKQDDCDGYAILIMKFMELAGIPAWRRRVVAGRVSTGEGHAWIVYFSEVAGMWSVVEGSYFAAKAKKEFNKLPFEKNKRYTQVWFCFNEEKAWSKSKEVFAHELFVKEL